MKRKDLRPGDIFHYLPLGPDDNTMMYVEQLTPQTPRDFRITLGKQFLGGLSYAGRDDMDRPVKLLWSPYKLESGENEYGEVTP